MLATHFDNPELFGNDAGEDEKPEVLASYFVDKPSFASFSDPTRRLQIARARKGMGKSALLAHLGYSLRLRDSDAIVIQLTGSDLTGLGEFSSDDPAVLVNQWQQVICARVNIEIGRRIKWALSDTTMTMVDSAELAGFKGRNFIGSLVDRMKGKLGPVELAKIAASDQAQLLQRYSANHDQPDVWLLIDDVDATYLNTSKLRNKISSFFSAARKLAHNVDGLRIRASVRTDVWSSLRENEDLDKCEQYVTDIQWSANELEEILAKKILSFVKRHELDSTIADSWAADRNQESLIELAFARRVSWGKSTVPPIHPIRILSARRPRWLAQLCRLAGAEAYRTLRTRIGMQEINTVLPGFGNLRISDLYKEHLHQFPDIKRLIECFALGPRRYRTADLQDRIARNYLAKVGTSNVPELDSASSPDARQLAHFVYKIGLIQGRAGGDSPTFVNYEDRPTLLTTSVNLDDGMLWEVYPSYRNALNIHKA